MSRNETMAQWVIKGRRPKFPDEAWVKKQVKSQLEQLEIWYYMPNGGYYSTSGIPDFVCCDDGSFLGIETKDSDGKWSQAQQDRAKEIIENGGFYVLVDEDGLFALWDLNSNGPRTFHKGFFDLRGADKK